MKNTLYIFSIVCAFAFVNCKSPMNDEDFKEQIYYLEIIDSAQTNQSKQVIEEAYSKLQNKEFLLSLEDNDWQGIIPYDDKLDLSDASNYYPEIHKFEMFNKNEKIQLDSWKIELIYNKLQVDNIPSFNILMYSRSPDGTTWYQFANPGNFRFNMEYYKEDEQAKWIKRTIVGLTFK